MKHLKTPQELNEASENLNISDVSDSSFNSTIDDVIRKLEELKKQHGNIRVCTAQPHEYWGTTYNLVDDYLLAVHENAQPNGPKSGKSEKCVVFCSSYDC
jgi:hypothetical protein